MPGRDVNRPRPLAGAEHGADALAGLGRAVRQQPRAISLRRAGLRVAAGEPRLRDADGGQVQPQAEMAGQPEAPRVGVAVAVAEDEIGRLAEPCHRLQQRRHLAEGQQARDVGEGRRALDSRAVEERESGIGQQHRRRPGHPPGIGEGHVEAGDPLQAAPPAGAEPVCAHDRAREPLLERDGLLRRERPGVQRRPGARRHPASAPPAEGPGEGPGEGVASSVSRRPRRFVETTASRGGTISSVSTAESARPPITTEPRPR